MVIFLLIFVPTLIMAGAVAVTWYRWRRRFTLDPQNRLPFRWRYIISPVIVLAVYIVLAAVFYNRLPDQTAYTFTIDGAPNRFAVPSAVVIWGMIIQLVMALIGLGIVFGLSRSGMMTRSPEQVMKPETLLTFMGNMPALPQLVFGFALYDIFTYNAFQKHTLPVWIFAIVVLAVATIAFFSFLVFVTMKVMRQNKT
jgi:uncharacterized membrane protein